MKIDVRLPITEYDGSPVTESILNEKTKQVEKTPITLKIILSNIVNTPLANEVPTAEDLGKRNQISIKLYATNEPDFSLAERTLILERLPKVYTSPRIFGIVSEALDPQEEVKPEAAKKTAN